jgi:acetyl esterase/lipase
MIHGGGHFALSRKAIQPAQTRCLISHGFLPVSIDYHLCPEVDIVNGPMVDLRDGYVWACTQLPLHLLKYNISVDCERVVVVGWPTGGHLALSAGWTTKGANVAAPTAILSFYAPVDFESKELDNHASSKAPPPGGHKKKILSELSGTVLTRYEVSAGEGALFSRIRPGDTRSDLILSMCRDGAGLSMLLHTDLPSPDQLAAICPLAQLRLGQY